MNNDKTTSTRWGRCLPLLLPFSLAVCGVGDGGEAGNSSTTAPTVSSTSPASSADDNISGSVSFDGISNVAIFTPSNPFSILTTYTATLSTAITDLSGNAFTVWKEISAISWLTALMVWEQTDGTGVNIRANRFE